MEIPPQAARLSIAGRHARVRRRCRALASVVLASAVVGWAGSSAWTGLVQTASAFIPTQVYTVADLLGHLRRGPNGWSGRVVLVSGAVESYPRIGVAMVRIPLVLSNPEAPGGAEVIVLVQGAPDPVLTVLRWLPLVRRVVPSAQRLRWGEPAVYRIKLRRMEDPACDTCYEAVLLDAAPGATQ